MQQVVSFTAWNRPGYLKASLASWSGVRGISDARLMFRVEPGCDEVTEICHSAADFAETNVTVNPVRFGESRNPWEAMNDAFTQTDADFVICGEDDDVVADDILEYFGWAAERFATYRSVFAVCAFQQDRQGGEHEARLEQYFQPWIWGIWRDRWEHELRGDWDFNYSHKGFDWHIREHHVQDSGRAVVFPCRSRVQIIGQEGMHFTPAVFPQYVSRCFPDDGHYDPGVFSMAGRGEAIVDMNKGAPRDPLEVEEYLWKDAAGAVGIDVGANMGQSVDKMSRLFGLVVAFEPADESFQVLLADWKDNQSVMCEQLALTDHVGVLKTAVRMAPIMTGQLTAVDMPYRGEHPEAPAVANWGAEVAQRVVPCTTLDAELQRLFVKPDFVKIDTEGHEYQVLLGATRTLAEDRPRLLIEFHSADLHDKCVQLLEEAGYTVETVRHPHYPAGSYMYTMHGWLRAAVQDKEASGE